jgi:HTH-type transcriptional regulator, sugar sensing transcriptional regulator
MSQQRYKESIKSLNELGFTELEAAVYSYLVENSPATPYRVAQDIGRPVANTYKAVEALYQKGAVLIDETKSRLCQAVPPDELLSKLKQVYLNRHQNAVEALAQLKPSGDHEKIFSLATAEQVFDRCQRLIEQAETIILIDAFPGVVEILTPWLEQAARRKITIVLLAYEPANITGVEVVAFQYAERMLRRWRGQWLIIVVDGAEYLFAYLSDDGASVYNAIWCGSAFLALPQHCNLALALRASILEELLNKGISRNKIQQELKRTEEWLVMGNRGYDKLADEFSTLKDK